MFWRLAIKPGRPVAMGMISGKPFIGLRAIGSPGIFVTFAHVVRPLLDALSGASPVRVVALPVVADFSYRKKEGRREYVRVSLHRPGDGRTLARKHPRDGAGVISSLTETDGFVELREESTSVAPATRSATSLTPSCADAAPDKRGPVRARLPSLRSPRGKGQPFAPVSSLINDLRGLSVTGVTAKPG